MRGGIAVYRVGCYVGWIDKLSARMLVSFTSVLTTGCSGETRENVPKHVGWETERNESCASKREAHCAEPTRVG
jgi:hypothetical protein